MYFTEIRKHPHYCEHHEKDVPWGKVVQIILTSKRRRKKYGKIEIEQGKFYLLCELEGTTLWVINAKVNK